MIVSNWHWSAIDHSKACTLRKNKRVSNWYWSATAALQPLHRNRWASTVAQVDHAVTPSLDVFDQIFLKRFAVKPFLKRFAFLIKLFLKKFALKVRN
jgi:hypothetical protein